MVAMSEEVSAGDRLRKIERANVIRNATDEEIKGAAKKRGVPFLDKLQVKIVRQEGKNFLLSDVADFASEAASSENKA